MTTNQSNEWLRAMADMETEESEPIERAVLNLRGAQMLRAYDMTPSRWQSLPDHEKRTLLQAAEKFARVFAEQRNWMQRNFRDPMRKDRFVPQFLRARP